MRVRTYAIYINSEKIEKKECTLGKNYYLCLTYTIILTPNFCMILNRTNTDCCHPISKWGGLLYINKL